MDKAKICQKEYLKKYLNSGDDSKKKKKKKKSNVGAKTVKIIDDDIDINNMRPMAEGEFDILNSTEDAPQIVGVIDDRGPVDFSDKRRWKIIADDGEGNVAVSSNQNRQKNIDQHEDSINDVGRTSKKRSNHSTKNSRQSEEDQSPPRISRKDSESTKKSKRKSRTRRKRDSSNESSSSTSSSSSSSSSSDSGERTMNKYKAKKNSKNINNNNKKGGNRDADSDLSPPRSRKIENNRNSGRKNSDSDLSPPRSKPGRHSNSDTHLPRKSRKESSKHKNDDFDLSPPRKSRREVSRQDNGSNSDLSPPRKSRKESSRVVRNKQNSDSDLSPPRMSKTDSRSSRNDNRKRPDSSRRQRSSRSPRRRPSRWDDEPKSPRRRSSSPKTDQRMKKTLDGKTAGLQNAKDLREETMSHRQREKELFSKMSAEVSGLGKAAVLRDRKTGKRRDLAAEAAEKKEKEDRQGEIDEKYAKWGRGLKQVDDQAAKLEQDLYEMTKPLARYANDADLDAELRAVEYSEDPMLAYIKEKQIKEGKRQPDALSYQGSYMPNRFGIKPGYRWDGVDRSGGYEKRWFEARNARTAIQEEAYKWSTADM